MGASSIARTVSQRGLVVIALSFAAWLMSCKSPAPVATDGDGPRDAAAPPKTMDGSPAPLHGPKNVTAQGESFAVENWSFALADTNVSIVDMQMSGNLGRVLHEKHALLVTNGGFFGTRDEPIGLATSDGHVLSKFSPTLVGGVLRIEDDHATLDETESFDAGISSSFAIQCKPRLVVHGAVNVKRDDGHRAERTALCIRDQGRTLDVVIARNVEGGPSLFALATHLAGAGCEDALNLDGGPSTGVAFRISDLVKEERPRGPLRHAIVFAPREH